MTILTLFFFVLVMAVGGLAIDIGRLYGVHNQMVSYVDNLALASASQLDGQSSAVSRACYAATGDNKCGSLRTTAGPLVNVSYSFTNKPLAVSKLIFLSQLSSGSGPTPQAGDLVLCTFDELTKTWSQCPANVNALAKYVAVSAMPATINYFVLPIANLFFGGSQVVNSSTIQLQATAGLVQETCGITPMMMCNPTEAMANGQFNVPIGRELALNDASSKSATWAPGDFGFIAPSSDAGGPCAKVKGASNQLDCMLAEVTPYTQCISADGIDMQTGQATSRYDSLNVRFDIWNGVPFSPSDANFAPAMNVEKGICVRKNGPCDYSAGAVCPNSQSKYSETSTLAAPSIPLPRDSCLAIKQNGVWMCDPARNPQDPVVDCFTSDGSIQQPCGSGSIGVGARQQDMMKYWSEAHPNDPTMPQNLQAQLSGLPRWSVYRYEIAASKAGNTNDGIVDLSENGGEKGSPVCAPVAAQDNPNLDRRELVVAVVNCMANGVNGSQDNVPVLGYVKLFLTEPVGYDTNPPTKFSTASNKTIYAEVLGPLTPHDKSGLVHSTAILYR